MFHGGVTLHETLKQLDLIEPDWQQTGHGELVDEDILAEMITAASDGEYVALKVSSSSVVSIAASGEGALNDDCRAFGRGAFVRWTCAVAFTYTASMASLQRQ